MSLLSGDMTLLCFVALFRVRNVHQFMLPTVEYSQGGHNRLERSAATETFEYGGHKVSRRAWSTFFVVGNPWMFKSLVGSDAFFWPECEEPINEILRYIKHIRKYTTHYRHKLLLSIYLTEKCQPSTRHQTRIFPTWWIETAPFGLFYSVSISKVPI